MIVHSARHGFSLVEMLVTVGIIAVLLSLLAPGLGYVREQARRAKCSSNLRQIGQGFLAYANENDGRLPLVYDPEGNSDRPTFWYQAVCMGLGIANDAWLKPGLFSCPDSKRPPPHYTMSWEVSGMKIARLPGRPAIPVLVAEGDGASGAGINNSPPFGGLEAKRHGSGANYLFVDGHVEFLTTAPEPALNHLDQW